MFRLLAIETFFAILVSVVAIMSKFLFVEPRRSRRLSKFLLREHAFI